MAAAAEDQRRLRLALLLFIVLSGCAAVPPDARLDVAAPPVAELTATPFFPQDRFQCGPAALATVLAAAGKDVSPEELVEQVYLPSRRGSLQLELISATRRAGRIPYRLDPSLDAVAAELRAGRPVLVLQNLGVSWIPRWHYAVVIGIDTKEETVVLRSGTESRRITDINLFLRTWQRGDFWAIVALRPGELPANTDHDRYASAIADLEAIGRIEDARRAWLPALDRWPASPVPAFGLGNIFLNRDDPASAERWYREALTRDDDYLMAANNLAYALAAQDRLMEAVAELESALGRSTDAALSAILRDSLLDLQSR